MKEKDNNQKDLEWFCTRCGDALNKQEGFSIEEDTWVCNLCGTPNEVSMDTASKKQFVYYKHPATSVSKRSEQRNESKDKDAAKLEKEKKEKRKREKREKATPEDSTLMKGLQTLRRIFFSGSLLLLVCLFYYQIEWKEYINKVLSFNSPLGYIYGILLVSPILYVILLFITTTNSYRNKLGEYEESFWLTILIKKILGDFVCPITRLKDFIRAITNSYPNNIGDYEKREKRKAGVKCFILMIVWVIICIVGLIYIKNDGLLSFGLPKEIGIKLIGLDKLIIYLLIINVVAFILFTVDYVKFKRYGMGLDHYFLCHIAIICGGALGALLAIIIFDRKYLFSGDNSKKGFVIYVIIMMALQAGIVFALYGPFSEQLIDKIDFLYKK